jgi:hypothetical protein
MISIQTVLLLLWIHFFADFVFQSSHVAINKSKNNLILTKHVLIYGICFIPISISYAVINLLLHFVVDYITSRMTSIFWRHNEHHWFFVTIGLDQVIHATCLISSYLLMGL